MIYTCITNTQANVHRQILVPHNIVLIKETTYPIRSQWSWKIPFASNHYRHCSIVPQSIIDVLGWFCYKYTYYAHSCKKEELIQLVIINDGIAGICIYYTTYLCMYLYILQFILHMYYNTYACIILHAYLCFCICYMYLLFYILNHHFLKQGVISSAVWSWTHSVARLPWNLCWYTCLRLFNAEIIGVYQHAYL